MTLRTKFECVESIVLYQAVELSHHVQTLESEGLKTPKDRQTDGQGKI